MMAQSEAVKAKLVVCSPYLLSCQDEKSLGCATHPRLTIVLKTTNWPVTFLKMDWRPFR